MSLSNYCLFLSHLLAFPFTFPPNDLLKHSHLTLCSLTCTLKWVVLFRTNCTVGKVISLLFLKCPLLFNSLGSTRWVETYEGAAKEGVGARKRKFGAEITLFSCGAAGLVHAREALVLVNGSNVLRCCCILLFCAGIGYWLDVCGFHSSADKTALKPCQ